MEDLIKLRDYAEQNEISWYICKQWLNNGLKTIGKRPYRTKKAWINEFLDNYEEDKPQQLSTKHQNKLRPKCNTKIDFNKYL